MIVQSINSVLQIAWLEGLIQTHGAYEEALRHRKYRTFMPPGNRAGLIQRLGFALGKTKPPPALTIGAMLQKIRKEHSVRAQDLFTRMGVSLNVYRMMEQDAISPLKISADSWKRFRQLLDVPVDELAGMIQRTHQLVFFRHSFKGILARHSVRGTRGKKALDRAMSEMYAKAKLTLPNDEMERLRSLISRITDER